MDGFDGDARDEASKCQDVTKAQVKAREGEILLKWSKPQPLKKTPHEQPRVNIDVNCPAVFNIRAFDVARDEPTLKGFVQDARLLIRYRFFWVLLCPMSDFRGRSVLQLSSRLPAK